MMVSRLAAPSVEAALKLVDTAIAMEAAGFGQGVPRRPGHGLQPAARQPRISYGEYDQSLRELAERLKRHTKLAVVLDNRPELFPPDSCPEAALYCGWYSLGDYVPSFTWAPGAVGYHLASMEAKRSLRRGATCGATQCWSRACAPRWARRTSPTGWPFPCRTTSSRCC